MNILSNHVPKPEINPLEALRIENKKLRTQLENYVYLFNTLKKIYETSKDDLIGYRDDLERCRSDRTYYRNERNKYRKMWLKDCLG
ncbi:MAG: hypothetical protein RBR08_16130 [Desulforegulaceae bacterium]|nr:hypothetical protein [Desulforegulaceae bacterium]